MKENIQKEIDFLSEKKTRLEALDRADIKEIKDKYVIALGNYIEALQQIVNE